MTVHNTIELDGSGPLYEQVYRALAQPIMDGSWGTGTKLPSEEDLAARLGLSRMTVNKAFQRLAGKGLVVRKRRVGTIVADQAHEHAVLTITEPADEIGRAGGRYEYELVERRRIRPNAPFAERLGLPSGEPLLHLRCLHRADGIPALLEDRFVSLTNVPEAVAVDFSKEIPGPWLLKRVPWTEARHAIRAENADNETAELLDVERGAACLIVERNTWQDGSPVTHVRLIYPGDRHRLVGHFSPGGSEQEPGTVTW